MLSTIAVSIILQVSYCVQKVLYCKGVSEILMNCMTHRCVTYESYVSDNT